jgi:Flp pilus assembly protein TadB
MRTEMPPTLLAALLVAALAALIATPIAGRLLRPGPRLASSPARSRLSRSSRHLGPDYASVLDAIARQVRSGSSLAAAIVDEVEGSPPLGAIADRLTDGGSLGEVLAELVPSDADLALAVQALSATAHLGGPIAATLDEAAAVLRERAAARAERRAHSSQARLSARVLTIVPVGFAAWSAVASHSTREIYVSTFAGGICAFSGLALNVVGWQWMKRIIGPT